MIQRSFILETLVDVIVRTSIVFALFLLFSGHNSPGGGFVAGLVFGISLMLEYIAGGSERTREILPMQGQTMLAFGLSLAVVVGLVGFLWGGDLLESVSMEVDVPVLGVVKTTSALLFDIGVFATVAGLVGSLIGAFGTEEDLT